MEAPISRRQAIPFTLLAQDRTTKTNGLLHISKRILRVGVLSFGWRAVIRVGVKGEAVRTYGACRLDALQSANELLGRFPDRIAHHEKNRVLQIVQEHYGTTGLGSQPRSSPCEAVPVGDGEGPLPVFDDSQPSVRTYNRFKRKRKPVQKDVRTQRDPSLQELELSPEKRDALGGDVRDGSQPSNTHLTSAPVEVKHRRWPAGMLVSAPPPTKKQRVDQESQTDNDAVYASVDRLRQHIQQYGNCQATKVLLPLKAALDLATFLTTATPS